MELIEPELHAPRRTFHDRYALPKDQRDKRNRWPRLMDCCLNLAGHDSAAYFENPDKGEFAVVDVVTKEKAWFEMPYGASPEVLTELIASHFGAQAFRVGPRLWFV